MTPRETIEDLVQSGIPREDAVRMAREEFERQRATKRQAPTKPDDWRGRTWNDEKR